MAHDDCIACCMKRTVVSGHPDITVGEAAALLAENSMGTLPVVDQALRLAALTTMRDMIHVLLLGLVSLVLFVSQRPLHISSELIALLR